MQDRMIVETKDDFEKFIHLILSAYHIESEYGFVTEDETLNVIKGIVQDNEFNIRNFMENYYHITNLNIMAHKIEHILHEKLNLFGEVEL